MIIVTVPWQISVSLDSIGIQTQLRLVFLEGLTGPTNIEKYKFNFKIEFTILFIYLKIILLPCFQFFIQTVVLIDLATQARQSKN